MRSGALGGIAVGATPAENGRGLIAAFRARSSRSVNVNVFCHAPSTADAEKEKAWIERLRPRFAELGATPPARLTEIYRSFVEDDDMLAMLVAERPTAVSFHFGFPSADRIRALEDAGIVLLGSATNVDEARRRQEASWTARASRGRSPSEQAARSSARERCRAADDDDARHLGPARALPRESLHDVR